MKLSLLFFLFLTSYLPTISQVKDEEVKNKKGPVHGNTYAVVIGIANYENKNIPNLNFPGRDAQVFASYLESKAGGLVPQDNIRLLIDTNATTAAIYSALSWLQERCESDKEDDNDKDTRIYFYFSGHGDVESETIHELGFLLSYNTPGNNYINNAVRLEDLNYYANTLSVKFNAKVVIITDACHSGKLAGSDYNGQYLVGKELATAKSNEIRIAACAPDELSQENEGWGGGRGIFSYYLVNGLKGLADKNRDSIVTLNEIQDYLDSCIANDAIMKENSLKQTPVLKGNDNFNLAVVNPTELLSFQKALSSSLPVQSNKDYFFSYLAKEDRIESIDYTKLNTLPKEEIAVDFIRQVKAMLADSTGQGKMDQLEQSLREDKTAFKIFNEDLVDALHTHGQKIINLYLQGDAAELERRRYYNSQSSGYDIYPVMYALALKLTNPDNPLSRILKVNQYYFTGVNTRLKIPAVDVSKQDAMIDEALVAQKSALALESNAAYIQNELGILNKAKKQFPAAENYFQMATALAPQWAIPWANLCGLYAETTNFDKSKRAGQIADSMQADMPLTNLNLGLVHELQGNLLYAEEFYHKAIDLNSRHYVPFERLGVVYMNNTQYAQADSFFHEADLRKKGYHFKENGLMFTPDVEATTAEAPFYCDMDTLILKKDDIMAFFTWGLQDYMKRDYINAVRIFKKVIALDKTSPLVFHYMGKVFYDQHKWEEAEIMFKFAARYHLDTGAFNHYCDSVINSVKYPYAHDCFELSFKYGRYESKEDHYFLASLYESWAHYEEAEMTYRAIIQVLPDELAGYIKLARLLEKLGHYTEAEKLIQSYDAYDKERTDRELNVFYRRAIRQFPEVGDWYYRLGLLLYDRAELKSKTVYLDTIIWFPKLNKEVFIGLDSYHNLGGDLKWDITTNGSPQVVTLVHFKEEPVTIFIPGTGEIDTLADAIYTPRKDAISFLSKADSLLTETETKAGINLKIGNLFVRAGSKKQAFPYYNKSIQLVPENASARLNLINVATAIYKNRAALEQLEYLYTNQQINFPDRLLLADFDMRSGAFDQAEKLLAEARSIHPYVVPEIDELMGRLYLLSHQPAKAIPLYKNFLATRINDQQTQYTIARLYAQTGNKTEAWKWLEGAMSKGFNYLYVLNNDPSWNDFRKAPQWDLLLKRFTMKTYPGPTAARE